MTQFDYIFVSFVCMCIITVFNALFAYIDFRNGSNTKGYISLAVSALCGAVAVFNLTQLIGMMG